MYDPQLMYCPTCGDEYVAGVKQCAGCRIDLLCGGEMIARAEAQAARRNSRAAAIGPDDDVIPIYKGQMGDVRRIETLLGRERIAALVSGDEHSCGKGCCPSNFYVNVRREDAPDAVRIIEAEFDRTTAYGELDTSTAHAVFNPHAAEVQCPACGTTFVPTGSECPDCGLCF
ncbi:MAG: hypothetical protein AB1568_09245 [Thermodesulfobacteriota bacterium]